MQERKYIKDIKTLSSTKFMGSFHISINSVKDIHRMKFPLCEISSRTCVSHTLILWVAVDEAFYIFFF